MKFVCPECKNDLDSAKFGNLSPEMVVECPMCGIVLLVKSIENEEVKAEIVDEGK